KTPNGLIAEPLKITGSGVLSSIIKSNGLVIISEEKEGLEHEEEVDVIIFKPLEE
ncbi:MAG: molybdopterin molybdenumtransferase MoeA, partial [Candidatus Verstraetearchaeota archaeon]|nr:molybdopterin molybdenumtransferase MoeA [Candidatus Verstraetearchaeota archaeon]